MSLLHRHRRKPLSIRELAVNPADVDEETYPVTIRLNRPMTSHEVDALAQVDPRLLVRDDGVVVPEAKLDDVAHDHAEWVRRLELATTIGSELEGEAHLADQRRDARMQSSASNAEEGDRTGQVGMIG